MAKLFVLGPTALHDAVMLNGKVQTYCGQRVDRISPKVFTLKEIKAERPDLLWHIQGEPRGDCRRCWDCSRPT